MIIKILGILDLFVGIVFWIFGILHLISNNFILLLGLFLLVKGIIFAIGLNVASFLDIVSSVIIIASTNISVPNWAIILVSIFLIQKGIFSLLG